jgi:UDP-N-acetylmuramate dehydrogenase
LNWKLRTENFRQDVPLADWCTLRVGGPARWFREARSETDAIEALRWAADRDEPVLVLGGGSNVVIADP